MTLTDYLVDTNVFIAAEQGRPLGESPPGKARISVVTLTALLVGVEAATDRRVLIGRQETLERARSFQTIPYGEAVAASLARLLARADALRRRAALMDAIIAATALAHDLTIWTHDDDFATFVEIEPGLRVHRS